MLEKPIDKITWDDVEALVSDEVLETRTVEFKRDAIGARDDDKREFLADVSSFANTRGGDIILGIRAPNGRAEELTPLEIANPDAELQRLEQIIRAGLEPRLLRIEMRWIPQSADRGAIVIRIPRSWVLPHRVIFREHSKFYARNTNGKYPMDVNEIRSLFNEGPQLREKIQAFIHDRANDIGVDEGPVLLNSGAKLIFHIIPISAFTEPQSLQLTENNALRPMRATGYNFIYTLDGLATYSGRYDADSSRAYTLLFRNGIVESTAHIGRETEGEGNYIYPSSFEAGVLEVAAGFLQRLKSLGVEPPFFLAFTLMDVRGYVLKVPNDFTLDQPRPLRRDRIFLSPVLCEQPNPDLKTLLRPIFDQIWQTCGYSRSFSFDGSGNYTPS